jgi:hypothetical protein
MSSLVRKLGLWVRIPHKGMDVWCVFILCLGRGLVTRWSVKWSWNWQTEARAQGGCRASEKKVPLPSTLHCSLAFVNQVKSCEYNSSDNICFKRKNTLQITKILKASLSTRILCACLGNFKWRKMVYNPMIFSYLLIFWCYHFFLIDIISHSSECSSTSESSLTAFWPAKSLWIFWWTSWNWNNYSYYKKYHILFSPNFIFAKWRNIIA